MLSAMSYGVVRERLSYFAVGFQKNITACLAITQRSAELLGHAFE